MQTCFAGAATDLQTFWGAQDHNFVICEAALASPTCDEGGREGGPSLHRRGHSALPVQRHAQRRQQAQLPVQAAISLPVPHHVRHRGQQAAEGSLPGCHLPLQTRAARLEQAKLTSSRDWREERCMSQISCFKATMHVSMSRSAA